MTRISCLVAAAVTVTLTAPTVVSAQDWLGRLARSAAATAAQGVVNNAVNGAVNGGSTRQGANPSAQPAPSAAPARGRAEPQAVPASNFAEPAPINFTTAMRNPNDMRFGPEHEAAKKAYEDFGKVDCDDCEGGYVYETWIRHARPELRGYNVLEKHVGAMPVGDSITWTGSRGARYALTVVGEQPIGDWPCKQLKWTGDRGSDHAERMGLYCKKGESWIDVF